MWCRFAAFCCNVVSFCCVLQTFCVIGLRYPAIWLRGGTAVVPRWYRAGTAVGPDLANLAAEFTQALHFRWLSPELQCHG